MAMLDLLKGMKVVDFSSYIAAPTCAKLLGEYGAEVIRIEPNISDSVRFVASQVYGCADGTNPLYDVINGNITVQEAMDDLMCRPIGHEADYL